MNKIISKIRSLLTNDAGNGEIVAVLVAVGIAVTLGLVAVQKIGTAAGAAADGQGRSISQLPGAR